MSRRRKVKAGDPKRAIAYRRVSTTAQDLGLEARAAAIAEWAQVHDIEIVATFTDTGVSGGTAVEDRPGLARALDSLRDDDAGLLLVHKRDRLARSVFVAAVSEKLAERNGARILAVEGGTNGDTPEAALMRQVIDAIAQYERATIKGRIVAALKVMKRQGKRTGSIPYGYRLGADGVHLAECPVEQRIVRRVRQLREDGSTYAEIGQDLVEQGWAPRSGGKWHATTLKRIVEHEGVVLACCPK